MKTYKVVIVNLDHRGIGAGTKTLHLKKGEQSILRCFAILDTQLLLDGLHNLLTTTQHAGSGATELNEELANLLTTHKTKRK